MAAYIYKLNLFTLFRIRCLLKVCFYSRQSSHVTVLKFLYSHF
ncbi:rCG55302, isoform CRA_b [Rattus norvegicus]|uniref:RCG55302, isoform CRA_b n=1 Tax=Rattus norvegicus TaxID=10116 RepID=A6J826_RAT|nr:rCG55302, isoform CRA_b [Rattus norvegicus]